MQNSGTLNLKIELPKYGLSEKNIRLFDDPECPDLLDYLDLIINPDPGELLPNGVAESQGRPLLFFVNESELSIPPEEKELQFNKLRHILACRGDLVYLARILPGELLVVPVSLSDVLPKWKQYKANSGEALTFFSRLAQGHFDQKDTVETDLVFREMFDLLRKGADELAELIIPENVLSLLGRALFFRFLCDRNIVTEKDTTHIAPKACNLLACFANSENLQATSQWLDKTFNGEFLPLLNEGNQEFFTKIKNTSEIYFNLQAIAQRFKYVGKGTYQARWSNFDFKHVPIGLLSQVYEAFCWKWDHRTAKETSVYYTPRKIAQLLVDEAFNGLPNPQNARILDPACGAGVFLVLAFRRLYRERWEKTNKRPDTKAIREILDKQITGFDISASALKLAALSLYLTAIELDPVPIPPEKLKFNQLVGKVLYNHRQNDDPREGPVIGSLGVANQFDGQFDLVLSNPPWTSLPEGYKKIAEKYTFISKAIVKSKGGETLAAEYQNPDFAPDLPYLWKSTEWCKQDGLIAMALPARILLKQEDIPSRARKTMFQLIQVTGIINGSNLSDTAVWPQMSQPFMLLFARNKSPEAGHAISFITPHYDKGLNRKGEIRIDSKSAKQIEIATTFEDPWIWKALAVGTPLDIEVIRRIKKINGQPLKTYWENDLKLTSCNGYMIKPKQKQHPADFLFKLPNLTASYSGRFLVNIDELKPFELPEVCRPRKRECYRAPLVLVKQSPGFNRENCWALLSFDDVAFSQDFYGYSSADHPESELLARYLFLFCHSNLWIYYVLMTASVFGAERRIICKNDLDDCLIVPIEKLDENERHEITVLSKQLTEYNINVMPEIDSFFGNLYNLDNLDLEVIRDTLDVCLPYSKSRTRAYSPPTKMEIEIFRHRLESVLQPFFNVLGRNLQIIICQPDDTLVENNSPFVIFYAGDQAYNGLKQATTFFKGILEMADDTGTTRIIQPLEDGLLLGILKQYRYWTPSRARLLGSEIVSKYMGLFEGKI